jgi:hypothetical protein
LDTGTYLFDQKSNMSRLLEAVRLECLQETLGRVRNSAFGMEEQDSWNYLENYKNN